MPVEMLLTVLVVGLVAIALGIGIRFAVAIARGRDPQRASRITTRNTVAVVGATLSLLTVGLSAAAEIGGGAFAWISAHPFAASNGALGIFGAVSSWAGINVQPWQWIAVAMLIPSFVLLVYELGEEGVS